LFQIDFREISETAPKWHEDVYVFCVSDARSKNVLGYFYLDLFARAGKYAHQCVIPLSPGTGTNSFPVVANISNLSSKGDPDNPALLAHGELITFFHEFGHAVHALVGKQPYPIYSWSWKAVPYEAGVEIDFLEVPSKGFEFFAWEKDILQSIFLHCSFPIIMLFNLSQ
jgi:thimet oligopeptidase